MKFHRVLLGLVLASLLGTIYVWVGRADAVGTHPDGFDPQAEAQFIQLINAERTSKGVAPLAVAADLTGVAENWSVNMANQGHIFHTADQSTGIGPNWLLLGENVGVGDDVNTLFAAFVASPHHYANIMDSKFDGIGVGVYWRDSRLWTTQRYRQTGTPPAQIVTPDPVVETVPSTQPPPTTTTTTTTVPPTTEPPTTIRPTTTTVRPRPTTTTTTAPPPVVDAVQVNIDAVAAAAAP